MTLRYLGKQVDIGRGHEHHGAVQTGLAGALEVHRRVTICIHNAPIIKCLGAGEVQGAVGFHCAIAAHIELAGASHRSIACNVTITKQGKLPVDVIWVGV